MRIDCQPLKNSESVKRNKLYHEESLVPIVTIDETVYRGFKLAEYFKISLYEIKTCL